MKLSEELVARGFISQFSAPTLEEILDTEKRVVYHGIDPTADSAHAGNFVNWMLLRHLSAHGHAVIFLVGGGTGLIGDPKPDAERVLLGTDEVKERVELLKEQAKKLLKSDEVTFVDNYEWLGSLGLLSFLRDIGKYFTVNELIKKEAIAKRLTGETGLSYTEFAYPLLQAYDYLVLYREKGCTLQVGGSDQWGNIIAGVDLVRRLEQAAVHAVTVPLVIDKTTGKKFGKSEGNAIWLSAEKTSPYEFYQFWFNTADENVVDYLKLFTLLPLTQIAEIEAEVRANPSARQAQRILAREVTALVHGEGVAASSEKVSDCLFGSVAVAELGETERTLLLKDAPLVDIPIGTALVDALVLSELAASKREARTFIESGAVAVDGVKVTDVSYVCEVEGDIVRHLKRGKKQVCLIKLG
jgi:tyrosyl-tRNA synthetase